MSHTATLPPQANRTLVRYRITAADTSGPMPSPGMSVTVCFMAPHIIGPDPVC